MPNLDKLLTITDAANYLKVSKTSLRRWTNSGRLHCYHVGSRKERRFLLEDLKEFISGAATDSKNLIQKEESSFDLESPESNQPLRKHICTYYKSPQEQWRMFRGILLEYINPKSKIVYIYNGEEMRVTNWIKSEGLDPNSLIQSNSLELYAANETYLLEGKFNIDRMLEFWKSIIKDAANNGIENLLLTGEMGWASSGALGCELLIPYEAELDKFLESYPWVTVVCQYPVYQFSGSIVYDNLCIHTHIQDTERLIRGFAQ